MMHSVPNCLTASQSFETSCFSPPSPLESSPPSSPFDFDLDLLPNEIVSPENLDFSLQVPLYSSLHSENLITENNHDNLNKFDSKSSTHSINTFSPDCQVPNSPSSFSIDSGILSPTMFSPSSEEQGNKSSGLGSDASKARGVRANSPGHQEQQQRNVPSASPFSMSPSSPIYSSARTQRRLSSTDSGKTSSSIGSVKSLGALNPFGGSDICINQSSLNLQQSLDEFAQLQQKVRLEQEGLSLPAHRFQIASCEGSNTERSSSTTIQSSFPSHSQVTNVLCSLNPYPPQMLAASKGGGKVQSSLSLKSKLHATIKTEPTFELSNCPSRKSSIYTTKPTPLLRQVLEEKSFEQSHATYGVKPLDFVLETNTLGSMDKSLGEPQSEPEAFGKQDVAGISNNPVISLAMDQVKKDILTTCEILSISPGDYNFTLTINIELSETFKKFILVIIAYCKIWTYKP